MTAPATILCVNAGSSSLKCALYEYSEREGPSAILTVLVEGIGRESGRWVVRDASGETAASSDSVVADQRHALHLTIDRLREAGFESPGAIGHRVVHGGPRLLEHVIVDQDILARLRSAVPFAPLHLPSELAAIEALAERYPAVPQVVCLDTAFHQSLPEAARHLALPRWVHDEGIRRYGFHGLSYEFLVQRIGSADLGRAVLAHLGSGASLAAVRDGHSVDTTMGFTPAGGIVMATRPGDLDPGTLVYLLREHSLDADDLERMVTREAGLLGISGSSADMETLLRAEPDDPNAALAIEIFCRQARKAVGGMATVLGGLDTLVFTAGIGESAPAIRDRICRGIEHLGAQLDRDRNAGNEPVVSTDRSQVTIRVVPTDENLMIARHTARLLP